MERHRGMESTVMKKIARAKSTSATGKKIRRTGLELKSLGMAICIKVSTRTVREKVRASAASPMGISILANGLTICRMAMDS